MCSSSKYPDQLQRGSGRVSEVKGFKERYEAKLEIQEMIKFAFSHLRKR